MTVGTIETTEAVPVQDTVEQVDALLRELERRQVSAHRSMEETLDIAGVEDPSRYMPPVDFENHS